MDDPYHLRELPPAPAPALPELDVTIMTDNPETTSIDPKTGALMIEQEDGGVLIDLSGGRKRDATGAKVHGANLAEHIDDIELSRIAEDVLEGIEADKQSRNAWVQTRAEGLKLLALDIEPARTDAANSSAPLEGMSTARSPLLLEAVLRFQANARAELLPAAGPAKVRNDTTTKSEAQKAAEAASGLPPIPDTSEQEANRLEIELNHYFTVIAREYYPDTNRMLFKTGFGGSGFKKAYSCPLRRRPVSESIDADDLIVGDNEIDLHNAPRVTHRIMMRQSVMKRMQLAGQYLDIDLGTPNPAPPDAVGQAENQIQGVDPQNSSQRPNDYKFTVYECYCELDIPGFEHEEDGEPTGLPLPYRVTIDLDSRKVLEIRRRWKESDERCIGVMPIVKYPFVDGLGFYGIGLLHIMGNSTRSVTAAWRMALDSGMFASFPGFLYSKSIGRQDTNVFRVPPGGGLGIDTGGQPMNAAVMPLPYKDATAGLLSIMQHVEESMQRVGMTAELQVGEGRQDAPVGTTLAMIEQATKIQAAVHKGLHAAQGEEFLLIRDLLAEDPDCLICSKNPKREQEWEREALVKALNNCNLVPAADPNTPSHMQRIMKALALKQLAAMSPQLYDPKAVDQRVLEMLGVADPDSLFMPPQPPQAQPPNPLVEVKMAEIAQKDRSDAAKVAIADKNNAAKIGVETIKANTERLELAASAMVHPEAIAAAEQFVTGFAPPFLPGPYQQ